jgi:hypothetical protein
MVWLKNVLRKVWDILTYPYISIRDEIRFRRRLKELRKKDPFIYK